MKDPFYWTYEEKEADKIRRQEAEIERQAYVRKMNAIRDTNSIVTKRADDPVIKRLLESLRAANIQNPDYDVIKKILEEGVDGRYLNNEGKNG